MKIEIPKITLDIFEIWGNKTLEKELEQQEIAVEKVWTDIYKAIVSSNCNIAYWDVYRIKQVGFTSFMRYALHRSTKKEGFLQLSVMEIRNGEIIPTSDSQHNNVDGFIRKVCRLGVDTVIIM